MGFFSSFLDPLGITKKLPTTGVAGAVLNPVGHSIYAPAEEKAAIVGGVVGFFAGGPVGAVKGAATAYSWASSYTAMEEAEKLADLQAERTRAETAEETTRTRQAQLQLEGMTRARIAASGVTQTGSMQSYLDEMKKTHVGEIDWMKKAGATKEQAGLLESKYASQTMKASLISSVGATAAEWYS